MITCTKGLEESPVRRKLSINGTYNCHYLSLSPWWRRLCFLPVRLLESSSSTPLSTLALPPASSLPIQLLPTLKGSAVHLVLQEAFFLNPPQPEQDFPPQNSHDISYLCLF